MKMWIKISNYSTSREWMVSSLLLTLFLFWLNHSQQQEVRKRLAVSTHSAGVAWVQTVEVLCGAGYGLAQGSHQLCLLYVLRLESFCLILPKQQGGQGGLPAEGLSPHHLLTNKKKKGVVCLITAFQKNYRPYVF